MRLHAQISDLFGSRTILSSFEKIASAHPEQCAIASGSTRVSYALLDRQSRYLAHLFHVRGVTRFDRVGFMLTNGPEFVGSFLGIVRSGAVAVPIDLHYATPELAELLRLAGCTAIVAQTEFMETARAAMLDAGMDPRGLINAGRLETEEAGQAKRGELRRNFGTPSIDPDHPLVHLCSGGDAGSAKVGHSEPQAGPPSFDGAVATRPPCGR